MIKIVGKKLISGDLNLTRISFPIKAMVPRTALENSTMSCCMNPYFMRKASDAKDPLERFKYVITNTISAFYYLSMFLKPVILLLSSLIQSLDRLFRDTTLTAHRSTVSRSPITLLSATFWQSDPKIAIDTMAAITSQLTPDSTLCSSSTKATKSMSSATVTESMPLSTKKSTQAFLLAVLDRKLSILSPSKTKRINLKQKLPSEKSRRGTSVLNQTY